MLHPVYTLNDFLPTFNIATGCAKNAEKYVPKISDNPHLQCS